MNRILMALSFFMIGSCATTYAHSGDRDSVKRDLAVSSYLTKGFVLYEGKTPTLHQIMLIKELGEARIAFHLFVENYVNGETASLHGIAKRDVHADLETDDDANGIAYFAGEYVYSNSCQLYIRLELPDRNRVRTIEADCTRYHDAGSPFGSVRILDRVNKTLP